MESPYADTAIAAERLYAEYLKGHKLVVAVDFDDTVFDYHSKNHKYENVIRVLKRIKSLGHYVVIFSCSEESRYKFIREFMLSKGIKVDSINENPCELPYGKTGKIFYNILLDDRAGLGQAIEILYQLIWKIEARY